MSLYQSITTIPYLIRTGFVSYTAILIMAYTMDPLLSAECLHTTFCNHKYSHSRPLLDRRVRNSIPLPPCPNRKTSYNPKTILHHSTISLHPREKVVTHPSLKSSPRFPFIHLTHLPLPSPRLASLNPNPNIKPSSPLPRFPPTETSQNHNLPKKKKVAWYIERMQDRKKSRRKQIYVTLRRGRGRWVLGGEASTSHLTTH